MHIIVTLPFNRRIRLNWAAKPNGHILLDWITNIAGGLAPSVVTQHIAAAHAVAYLANAVLTAGDVLPQDFHLGAVGGGSALAIFGGAFGGMAEEEEPLSHVLLHAWRFHFGIIIHLVFAY